ncbi:hypothetical protein [Paenibacillus thalictri]|uniref:Uncharacterized protein n=1 Tax=Paenibacillus thalictri TaxID=2527873 RepID=A0A4Q9DHJ5_9BACL|nr:hypothetical protein [Paenibacillus thalictri]TBL72426.1 hypothetical protein EYB31_29015 [Paenibacillus thalictri]
MSGTYRCAENDGNCELWRGEQKIASVLGFSRPDFQTSDRWEQTEPGVFRWERSFVYTGKTDQYVAGLFMEVEALYPLRYSMIPGVSYDGNGWGQGKEPKGLTDGVTPWSFAAHRTTVAGATYSEGNADSLALFGVSVSKNGNEQIGFSCSLEAQNDRTLHRLIWPECECPRVYCARDQYEQAYERTMICRPGDVFIAVACVVLQPVELPKHGWHKLLEVAWRQNVHPITAWHEPDRIWELGITYARDYLWVEDGDFRGFVWGLHWHEGAWVQKRDWPYEIGWVGQNASLANSLLEHYVLSGDEASLAKGLAALDTWAAHAPLENGLFRCRFQHIVGYPLDTAKCGAEVQDACNLSTAALQYFESARLAARCGVERPQYERIALGICDFAVHVQEFSGRFGKAWRNDGSIADPEGTIGCYLVPPLLEAYRRTGDRRYLHAAKDGYHYYIGEFIANGYSTAGALDTYCIDKESAIPLLRAGLELFELTRESAYLDGAVQASWYIASWQLHHSIHFPEGSVLHEHGYDSFGGTTVSAQHHHIDHFAVAIVPEWLRLAAWTGDDTWRQRALAAWANATAFVSDGALSVSGHVRPPGGQDEGICHTRWHTRWGEYFGVSQWLVAWPTAFRLEVLRGLNDWSVLMGNK